MSDYEILSNSSFLKRLAAKQWSLTMNACRCDYLKNQWCIPEREMDEHLVFFVESGPLRTRLDGIESKLDAGMAVWVPPGCTRELWSDNRTVPLRYYKMRFVIARGDRQATLPHVAVKRNAWDLLPVFQMLVTENCVDAPWRDEQMRHLLCAFSTLYFRLPAPDNPSERTLSPSQRMIVEEYVITNFDRQFSSADMARALSLSQDYFSRLFVRTYGEAPRSYVKRARIRYAANRLTESSVSVKELAAEMGYTTVGLFCRQFKEVERVTPTQYRRRETRRSS